MKKLFTFSFILFSLFTFAKNLVLMPLETTFYATYSKNESILKVRSSSYNGNISLNLYTFPNDSITNIVSEKFDSYSNSTVSLYVSGKDSLYIFEYDPLAIEFTFKKRQSIYAPNIIKIKNSRSKVALHFQSGFNHEFQLFDKKTNTLDTYPLTFQTTHFHDFTFSSDTSLAISYVAKNELDEDIMKISCYKTADLSLIPTFNYEGGSWQHTSIGNSSNNGLYIALNFAHKLIKLSSTGEIISDTTISRLYDIVSSNSPNYYFYGTSLDGDLFRFYYNVSTKKFTLESTSQFKAQSITQSEFQISGLKKGITDTIALHESSFGSSNIYDLNITAFSYSLDVIGGVDSFSTKQSNNFTLLKQDLNRLELKDVAIYSTNSKCVAKTNDSKNINTNDLKAGLYILTAIENSNAVKYRLLIE
jgi:dTDP-4-dehydrorhamnose 3,5-epimerase-like enzyme